MVENGLKPLPGWAYPQQIYTNIHTYLRNTIKKRETFKQLLEDYQLDPLHIFTNGYLRHIFEIDAPLSFVEYSSDNITDIIEEGGDGGAGSGADRGQQAIYCMVVMFVVMILMRFPF